MMKPFLLLLIIIFSSFLSEAQTKGAKIGYIDMEYILENIPDYTAAKILLEEKAQNWKQEIEVKKNVITKFKEVLKTERAFLTKELLEERNDEIKFLESELLDHQQKRFGPNGDLIIQKSNLVKPIQDQIFTAVQDLAENKKYDFIFDKSSDFTILFGAKKYDISDQIVKVLVRASKRMQLSKKELKEIERKEAKEDLESDHPVLSERNQILENRRAERALLAEERRKAFEERRDKLKQEKEAKKIAGQSANSSETEATTSESQSADSKEEKKLKLEEHKKQLEIRKQEILEAREAAKRERKNKN